MAANSSTPLLNHHQRPTRRFKYRFQAIESKGAILLIFLGALMRLFQYCLTYIGVKVSLAPVLQLPTVLNMTNVLFIVMIFYPLGGLMADMWIGRYRMILGSTLLSLVVWLLLAVTTTLMWAYKDMYQTLLASVFYVCLFIFYVAQGAFLPVIIPFNIDQLMGASGDELSATVYWHSFCTLAIPIVLFPIEYSSSFCIDNEYVCFLVYFSIGGVSLTLALCIHFLCNHWLDVTAQSYNPIKQIYQVLNYARKNKYPRNRSALTYWEEKFPSRLDLGKDKYGGPFTVEQVEDVRTFFQLLPVLLCVSGLALSEHVGALVWYLQSSIPYPSKAFMLAFLEVELPFSMSAVFILLYQFLLYPCFANYIPSMLKKIAAGLVFAQLTLLSCVIILLIGHVSFRSSPTVVPIDYKWVMVPQMTSSLALFLVRVSSIEFIVAQSPKSMRGLMVGLWYSAQALGQMANSMVFQLFNRVLAHDNEMVAALYMYLFSFVVVSLILLVFLITAKRYKLRVRENVVPVRLIAEEHYERYQEQSEFYRRALGLPSSKDSF